MSNSIELTRKIHEEAMAWYRAAESKAQILLGVLGTFTGILTVVILGKPGEIRNIIETFNPAVMITAALSLVAILFGMLACYNCLRSRVNDKDLLKGLNDQDLYPPYRLFFFGFHSKHEPSKLFNSLISIQNEADQIRVYSHEIIVLSQNVLKKHAWINRAFFSVSAGIFLLVLTTALYLINFKTV